MFVISAIIEFPEWKFVRPRLPRRFSLRTMLIATTLVAVVLGLAAWVGR